MAGAALALPSIYRHVIPWITEQSEPIIRFVIWLYGLFPLCLGTLKTLEGG